MLECKVILTRQELKATGVDVVPNMASGGSRYDISSDEHEVEEDRKDTNDSKNIENARRVLFPRQENKSLKNYPSKKNYCLYCKTSNTKLARHLTTVHKLEEDVQELLKFPKGSHERLKILETLRKKGNYMFNTMQHSDEIYLVRKPHKTDLNKENYKPCPTCKGYYSIKSLRQHYAKCGRRQKGVRSLMIQSRVIERKIHLKANKVLREIVFPVMREDNICKAVRYDELVILLGNRLCDKYRSHHHHDMIRAKMRLLGRFVLAIKDICGDIHEFKDALKPQNFNSAIQAINVVAQLDHTTARYKTPAPASALGLLLKDSTRLLITECIKKQDDIGKKSALDFLKLLESELNVSVNKTVAENQSEMSRQKKVVLPEFQDIKTLTIYLHNQRQHYYSDIETKGYSYKSWDNLSKLTLVSILIFNRRRPGELERATIENFNSACSIDEEAHKDIYNSLTEDGKKRAKEYVRFRIRGKKGRTVPVLLDKFMVKCVECVINHRNDAGVSCDNPYIFGKPSNGNTHKYHRAYALLNTYSNSCGALRPQTLKATELRKHVATASVKLNLRDNEMNHLQDFLGHAERIHKEYYRQPLIENDIINMTKLLGYAQTGKQYSSTNQEAPILNTPPVSGYVECGQQSPTTSRVSRSRTPSPVTSKFTEESPTTSRRAFQRRYTKKRKGVKTNSGNQSEVTQLETTPKKRPIKRLAWITPERRAINSAFSNHINNKKLPSFEECRTAQENNPILKRRTLPQIKAHIANEIKRRTTFR